MEAETYNTLIKENNSKAKKTCVYHMQRRLFSVFDLAIDYSSLSKFGVIIICFFELLQLLSFSFNIIFINQWIIQDYVSIFELVNKILRIFLIEPYFKETSFVFFQIMFFALIIINILILAVFAYLMIFIKNIKRLSLIALLSFNLFGQLYNSVLLIPTLDIIFPMLRCNKYFSTQPYSTHTVSWCSTSTAYVYLALGIIGIIIAIIIGLLFSLFYYDVRSIPKQKKENLMATITNMHNVYLFIDKIIICVLFFGIDDLLDKANMFLAFSLFASSVLFAGIIRLQHSFFSSFTKKAYNVVSYIFAVTNLLVFLDKIIEYFKTESFHGIFEIWIICVVASVFFEFINEKDLALNIPSLDIKYPSKVIHQLHLFAKLIKLRLKDKAAKKIVDGYICIHCDSCQNSNCLLKSLQQKALIALDRCPIVQSNSIEEDKLLYIHLNEIYLNYISQYFNDASLRISYGFFSLLQFKNVNVAKMHLYMAYTCKPTLIERFDLFRLDKAIEDEYLNINDESLNIDIASTLIFEQYYKQFQTIILQIGIYYNSFWTKFNQAEMSFAKIKSNGLKIIQLISKVFKLWKSMQNIQPNDRESLRLYGIFLSEILNERTLGQSYIDRSLEISSQGFQVKLFKTDINSICTDGSPVCIATPNENQELIITQVNQSISRWFGYTKMELIGKNIDILIPEVLRKFHELSVVKYIKAKTASKTIEQKRVFSLAVHRTGYVFPVKLILILMPSLTSDAHVGIVLKKNKKYTQAFTSHLIINNQMDIINISSQCIKLMEFSEKAIWTIKNYSKIKANERVNLKKLIQEFSASSSLIMPRNSCQGESGSFYNINNANEESNALRQIKSIINEPNQLVTIVYFKETTLHSIKTGVRRMSNIGRQFIKNESKKDTTFKKISTPKGRMSNFNTQSSITSPSVNRKQYYQPKQGTTTEIETPIQAIISIAPIKFALIDSGYYIVQLRHEMKHSRIKNASNKNAPMIGYPSSHNQLMIARLNFINDIKYCEKYKIMYDQDQHKYLAEKSTGIQIYTMSPVQKAQQHSDSNLIIVDKLIDRNNVSSTSSLVFASEREEDENDILIKNNRDIEAKKDVYNTLNFTDYSQNVIFYELNPKSLMCGHDSKPPPQEGKSCQDLTNFFDQDTQKEENEETDDESDDKFDKNKYEIRKSNIFQSKKQANVGQSIINLRIGSFVGIVIHIIIATSSYVLYENFLGKCDIYTKGLYHISSLLNYTITSSDVFLDLLIIQTIDSINRDTKLIYFKYIKEILKTNSAKLNELSSLTDTDTVLSIVDKEVRLATASIPGLDPLQMMLSHLVAFDKDNKPVINQENCTFNDATIQLMSVIYTLSQFENLDVSFFDKNVFFICFNTMNDYYIKSIDYIKSIGIIIHNISPTENQTTIIYISLGVYILLLLALFFILRKNLIKINNIVLKFLLIQPPEIQSIMKQSTKFLRYIRIIHNKEEDEDDIDQEDDNDIDNNDNNIDDKNKRHTSRTLQSKMKRSVKEDLFLVIILSCIFIPMELYYIIQFIIVYSFNNNLDQFVELYSSSYFYITNLILISSSAKILRFVENNNDIITLLNKPIEETLYVCLDQLMTDKESLSREIFISQFLSENFSNYYNEEIAFDIIGQESISYSDNPIRINLSKLNFDSAHAHYYNMIRQFYSSPDLRKTIISQANTIKNQILSPFIQKLCDAVYDDVKGFLVVIRTFVIAWYICVFIVIIILYFTICVPMELKFEKEFHKTKWLLLLIPTKILLNKKSILDILKKENMVSIKK